MNKNFRANYDIQTNFDELQKSFFINFKEIYVFFIKSGSPMLNFKLELHNLSEIIKTKLR